MSLTAGATLQNEKIIIESTLHQSDFGITYRATHAFLDRPVILQSFNPILQQRSDFQTLRQTFLQRVLLLSKQPDSAQVLDCFEENGMPFVVLEATTDRAIPQLTDWLEMPIAPEAEHSPALVQENEGIADREAIEQPSEQHEPMLVISDVETDRLSGRTSNENSMIESFGVESPGIENSGIENPGIENSEMKDPVIEDFVIENSGIEPIELIESPEGTTKPTIAFSSSIPEPAPDVALAEPLEIRTASAPTLPVFLQPAPEVKVLIAEKPKKWLPMALLLTALITGCGGVGLGLALRFKPTPQVNDPSPGLSSGWFGRDQTFPPKEDWPVTETPNLFPASPTVEQPLYRSSPPLDYTAPSSPAYIPPAAPPSIYRAEPPGIADYPPPAAPVMPPIEPEPPPAAEPPAPEPIAPLPEPITPEAPEVLPPDPPAAGEPDKAAPTEAPIIFDQ
jgi:hypothetical protein